MFWTIFKRTNRILPAHTLSTGEKALWQLRRKKNPFEMAKWNPKYSTSSSVMSLNSSQSFVLPKPTLKMEKLKMRIWYNGILCACLYKNRIFYDGKNSRTFAVVGLFFPESKKVTRLLVFVLLQIYKSISSFHCDVLFCFHLDGRKLRLLNIHGDLLYYKMK